MVLRKLARQMVMLQLVPPGTAHEFPAPASRPRLPC